MMPLLKRFRRPLLGLTALAVIAALALLISLWILHNRPVVLPSPTGPYPVGRVEYDWVDSSRADLLADGPGQPRKLSVWIWYPGNKTPGAIPAPYLPPAWAAARAGEMGIGQMLRQNPARVQGHSYEALPLAADQPTYPVLILQPGLGPILPDYTTLAESLASSGYIVVGSTPTGSAGVVVFQDGEVARGTEKGNIPDSASVDEAHRILGRLIQVWAADDRFVLDQAERLNAADPAGRFTGRMDMSKVGVLGHSFGGATAAEFCHLDARCKAGADLDGYPYGDVIQAGVRQPFLFLWSEASDPGDPSWQQAQKEIESIWKGLPPGSLQITIRGMRHFNFSDNALGFEPVLRLIGGLGPIDGAYGLKITTTYVRAFFDQTLRGQHDAALDEPPYTEVTIKRR